MVFALPFRFRTNQIVFQQIQGDKRIAIPYCNTDPRGEPILGLWRLRHQDELVRGSYGILEPPRDRWSDSAHDVDPLDLDIAIVPGVAFTRHGARLGNGKGYFDRLLQNVHPDCTLIGVCYESQLVEELPTSRHDVWMDMVVTEQNVYRNET